jgi:hypothetical protein
MDERTNKRADRISQRVAANTEEQSRQSSGVVIACYLDRYSAGPV